MPLYSSHEPPPPLPTPTSSDILVQTLVDQQDEITSAFARELVLIRTEHQTFKQHTIQSNVMSHDLFITIHNRLNDIEAKLANIEAHWQQQQQQQNLPSTETNCCIVS